MGILAVGAYHCAPAQIQTLLEVLSYLPVIGIVISRMGVPVISFVILLMIRFTTLIHFSFFVFFFLSRSDANTYCSCSKTKLNPACGEGIQTH